MAIGTFQAEAAILTTGQPVNATARIQVRTAASLAETNFTGSGYVDFGDGVASGESIVWTVAADAAGSFDLLFRYGLEGADRPLALSINGGPAATLAFSDTADFSTWQVLRQTVELRAGSNTITLASTGFSGPNIDSLQIVEVGDPGDVSADGDGDLALTAVDGTIRASQAAATPFLVTGLDADIQTISVSLKAGLKPEGPRQAVTADAAGRFALDLSGLEDGPITARLFATDAAGNVAETTTTLTLDRDWTRYQAETVPGGAAVFGGNVNDDGPLNRVPGGTNATGSDGNYADFITGAGEFIEWTVDVPADGDYDIAFRYGLGAGTGGVSQNRPMRFDINGVIIDPTLAFNSTSLLPGTPGFSEWGIRTTQVALQEGANTIRITTGTASGANFDWIEVRPAIAAPALPPTDITLDGVAVDENAAGAVIGTLTVRDADDDRHTLTVDDARFEVVGGELRLRAGESLDHEAAATVTLHVTATDGDGLSLTQAIDITVGDVNEAPGPISLSPRTVAENAIGAAIGAVTVPDPDDGDTLTLSVDDDRFIVTEGALRLRDGTALDFEADGPAVTVTITATDEAGLASTEAFAIAVTDVNEAPGEIRLTSAGTVSENLPGAVIGAFIASDPDFDDSVTFTVDDERFSVDADGTLRLAEDVALDFEVEPTVTLTVTATDTANNSADTTIDITVTDTNDAPTGITLANATVDENADGATIGTLIVADQDADDTHTFTVSDPRFEVVGDLLRLKDNFALDFEADATVTIEVTATDALGAAVTTSLTIIVNDRDEAGAPPEGIALEQLDPVEENASGAIIGTLSATDPDGTAVAFTVADDRFVIVGNQLRLATDVALDFETTGPSVVLAVTAIDEDDEAATSNVTVTVADVNEAPTAVLLAAVPVVENDAGAEIGTLSGTDPDAGDTLSFAVIGDDRFMLTGNTLKLKAGETLDYEAAASVSLQIRATDADGLSFDNTVTFAVLNDRGDDAPNNPPTGLKLLPNRIAENLAGGIVGKIIVTDADPDDTHSFILGDDRFEVNAAGDLKLRDGVALDYEIEPLVKLRVTATDAAGASFTRNLRVRVQDQVLEGGPIVFTPGAITSYTANQDQAPNGGYTIGADGTAITLTANTWKKVDLGSSLTITANTVLSFGFASPVEGELHAIGFDSDNGFGTGTGFGFQLFGTQNSPDLSTAFDNYPGGGGTVAYTISLAAFAGQSVRFLTLINDDDAGPIIGRATYTDVRLSEQAAPPNQPPVVVGGGIADRTVDEDSLAEIALAFADPEGGELTYTLVTGPSWLTIVDGALVGTPGNDDVAGPVTVTVRATDAAGATATDSFQLGVRNVNDAPTVAVPLTDQIGSIGTPFLFTLAPGSFADVDIGDALTLNVDALPQGVAFDAATGTFSGTPTRRGTFAVTVTATDAAGARTSDTFAIVIAATPPSEPTRIEAEAFTGLGAGSTGFFLEAAGNASGGQLVRLNAGQSGSVSTELGVAGVTPGFYTLRIVYVDETDGISTAAAALDGETIGSWSFDGIAGSKLNPNAIVGANLQLGNRRVIEFTEIFQVGADSTLTLSATQQGGEFARIDYVDLIPAEPPENLPPTAITLDNANVAENAAGATIGLLTVVDPDTADTHTLAVDDTRFEVVGSALKLKAGNALDHEAAANVRVTVTAIDAGGNSLAQDFTIVVGDVNEAPTAITLAGSTVAENAAGAVIGTLTVADPDAGATFTYAVDDARFEVVAGQLKLKPGASLDFEAGAAVGVTVTAADQGGLGLSQSFTVTVTDVNEEPVFTAGPTAVSVAENTTAVGAYAATDPDAGATLAFAIAGGTDAARFTIDAATGALAFVTAPDFEAPADGNVDNLYAVQISVSDGSNTVLRDVAVTVTDVLESVFGSPVGVYQAEAATLATGPQSTATNFLQVKNVETGFLGGGYADFGDGIPSGETVTWTIGADATGAFDLQFRYSLETGTRPLALAVNGGPEVSLGFGATGDFSAWQVLTQRVTLVGGQQNTIALRSTGASGPNIDQLQVVAVGGGTDTTADADGNLTLLALDADVTAGEATAVPFRVTGLDADIVVLAISFDGGLTRQVVTPAADGSFSISLVGRPDGVLTATLFVTDATGNEASTQATLTLDATPDFVTQRIQAEAATVGNDGEGTLTTAPLRLTTGAPNESGAEGQYVDFNGGSTGSGEFIDWSVVVEAAGTYELAFRYALAAATGGVSQNRPMRLEINGVVVDESYDFPSTTTATGTGAFSNWGEIGSLVQLSAGENNIRLTSIGSSGPNFDWLEIRGDDTTPPPAGEFVARINFQPSSSATPAGYVADNGQAYNDEDGFGWITEASLTDGVAGTIPDAIAPYGVAMNDRRTAGVDPRLTSYGHFEFPGAPDDSAQRWAWEMALDNGTYAVTVSIGDTGGPLDSLNVLNIEGQNALAGFVPTAVLRSTLVTTIVDVTDGRLTLDSIGGTNTEIQYLEVKALPDLTPDDGRPAAADYPLLSDAVATVAGQAARSLLLGTGISTNASFAIDVTVVGGNGGVDAASLAGNVTLYSTLTGQSVGGQVNTSGGLDAIVFTPNAPLAANTSYTLRVDGVTDLSGTEFQPYSVTFGTGATSTVAPREVAFVSSTVASGGAYASLVVSPDGTQLYAAGLDGSITRWNIDAATGALGNQQSFSNGALAGRPMIGITFDPTDPDVLWVSSNGPGFANAADFSGKIVKVTIGDGAGFTATTQDYVVGLPRSIRDHLSNSLAFNDGKLYLIQGGNSAMGAPDNAWGNRPERLLGAAVLEIDPTRNVSAGPIDVQTQDPNVVLPPGAGAQPSFYDPFAANAPVTLYATGIRNAYDLVWHSNGQLYVPVNGSAAGGNTPDDPNTPINEARNGVSTQNDYLFRVAEGNYYGHPNPVRGEYILNGGNPTAGPDPGQVGEYAVGTTPPANYGGFAYDFSRNRSPNGVIEYRSNIFGDALQGSLLVVEYSGGDDIVVLKLDAAGNVIGNEVIKNAAGQTITFSDPVDLIEHVQSGRLYVANLANGSISLLTPTPGDATPDPEPTPTTLYEAEAAVLVGAVVRNDQPNFTGAGFADYQNPNNDSITWTVNVTTAGQYDIGFRYALANTGTPAGGRPLALSVNSLAAGTLAFVPVGADFTVWGTQTALVTLAAGSNTIRLTATGASGPNIDSLFVPTDPFVPVNSVPTIVGDLADRSINAGTATSFTLDGLTVADPDTGDIPVLVARLADDLPLPSFLSFDAGTRTLTAAANAPAGLYDIEVVASDGEAFSTGAVRFLLEIAPPVNLADLDRDGVANAADTDDDNDGTPDIRDPFLADPTNGMSLAIGEGRTVVWDFDTKPIGAPNGWGLGLTGLRVNGTLTPEQLGLGNPNLAVGGGVLHMENVPAGDTSTRNLVYGAQVGIDPIARFLKITTVIDHPWNGITPDNYQNFGLSIGTGDQDNFVKLVVEANNATSAYVRVEVENNDVRDNTQTLNYTANQNAIDNGGADDVITLSLLLDTLTGKLVPSWVIETTTGVVAATGNTITLTGNLLAAVRGEWTIAGAGGAPVASGLAIGVHATSIAAVPYDIDFLSLSVEGLVPEPEIALTALGGVPGMQRLIFSHIDDPTGEDGVPRDFRSTATLRVQNSGLDTLNVAELDLDGPFRFVDPADAALTSVAANTFVDLEIAFDRSAYNPATEPDIFTGSLRIVSDDPDAAVRTIDLAGFWQSVDEGGQEPNVNEVWEVFGFDTRVNVGRLDNRDIYEAINELEVLVPYWQLADGVTTATVTQIAAWHGPGSAQIAIHAPGDVGLSQTLLRHDGTANQTLLPDLANGSPPVATITRASVPDAWAGDDVFGFRVAAASSDPTLNEPGGGSVPAGTQRGHFLRFFKALDEDGAEIANTYLVAMDYTGINYDYNDNMYLISGIAPVPELLIA